MNKLPAPPAITLILALAFAVHPAHSEPSRASSPFPGLPPGEAYVYRVEEKIQGKSFLPPSKIIRSEHSFSAGKNENGQESLIHTCREISSDGARRVWVFKYRLHSGSIRQLGYSLDKFTPAGDRYHHEESWFGDPFYKLPPDTVHVVGVPFVLTGMDFKKGRTVSRHIYAQEGVPTAVRVKVEKQEHLKVPWKELETWKVKISVDKENTIKPGGVLGRLITQVLPEFTVWYEKSAPHRPVKITTEFGPLTPGRPRFVQELVEVVGY